ncbi:hypothetical protein P3X46_003199 [Hevea brasiliensis]|uniref:Beta-glucosidase n=1 Tax=Hevea brasiliensis TaxID=3981 RepID=A0ABQ9NAB4_HEVBR|nr:hypothetical protein P3X46_003199 [Hevea brasiliensis]
MWLRLYCLLNLAVLVFCTDKYSREDFPPGFIFGINSLPLQNYWTCKAEGAANEDGRSPSVWDTFAHEGGCPTHGQNRVGCIQIFYLMVKTYPKWKRKYQIINPKGLLYYNILINELISHGIQAHVMLFHFDHPQALEDEYGGWVSRKIVKDFAYYADVCFREFGDRVACWTTLNGPNVDVLGGYDTGHLPPERCSPPFGLNCTKGNSSSEPYLVAHHLLLAHASTVRLYRENYQVMQDKQLGFIGLNFFVSWPIPLTNSTEDTIATRRALDFLIGLILNPLVFGDNPYAVKNNAGLRLPAFSDYESKQVKGAFDFLGLNHYSTDYVTDN